MYYNTIMKDKLSSLVSASAQKLIPSEALPRIEISIPQERYGDFSTNLPLLLSPKLDKPPFEIASFIAAEIQNNSDIFEKVEAMKNGFINFTLSLKFLQNSIEEIILKDRNYGKSGIGKGIKVLCE